MSFNKDSMNMDYLAYQMGIKFHRRYLLDLGKTVTRPNRWYLKLNNEVDSFNNTLRIWMILQWIEMKTADWKMYIFLTKYII